MATEQIPLLRRRRAGAGVTAAGLLVIAIPSFLILGLDHLDACRTVGAWSRTRAEVTSARLESEGVTAAAETDTARVALVLDYGFEVDGRRYEVAGQRSPEAWAESYDLAAEVERIRSAGSVEVAYDPRDPESSTAFPQSVAPGLGLLLAFLATVAGLVALAAFLLVHVRLARLRRAATASARAAP